MTTTKKTGATYRQDAEDIGRNLVGRGQKLVGNATNAALDGAEKLLAGTLKRLQRARAQTKPKA